MSWFKFNDISSEELGLILTKTPFRPSWAEESEEVSIPGRAAKLRRGTGTYASQELSLSAVIENTTKIHEVYKQLRGAGKLILSTAPTEYLDCEVRELVPEGVALTMAELPITFVCSPFARAVTPTIIDLTTATSYALVNNAGTVKGKPIITFKPSGTAPVTININGEDFVVEIPGEVSTLGWKITIDSEIMIAYYTRNNGDKVSCTEYTTGHFPLLHVGENYIKHSGGVTEMTINMNERWY